MQDARPQSQPQYDARMRQYIAEHQNPWNRFLHLIGIPTLVVALLLGLAEIFFVDGLIPWIIGLVVVGTACQLIGHRFEGNKPSATKNPLAIFTGLRWWFELVRGRG